MATGFIYVVDSVSRDYQQENFHNVPTEWRGRLYFGPCKMRMRPRMNCGDYVLGVSPSRTRPRRIVFVSQIQECITFAQAYRRFLKLRGPDGPIHVRPIDGSGCFPQSCYQHIPDAMHANEWERDLASPELDRFFVSSPRDGWLNNWLGPKGPEIDEEMVAFFNSCSVYGPSGYLGQTAGTLRNPIAYGRLYTGIHLETDVPEELVALCGDRMTEDELDAEHQFVPRHQRRQSTRKTCGIRRRRRCR